MRMVSPKSSHSWGKMIFNQIVFNPNVKDVYFETSNLEK